MSLENNKSKHISISLTEIEQNDNKNKNNKINESNQLNRNMFEFKYVIGKGGFGKVWQVIYKKTKEKFALKEMSKMKIIDKKSQKFINNELTILKKLHNDFIVNMHYAFQDKDNLYLVIDFLSGGDLRYHVSRYRTFSEEQTRFFISCIILGLSHIHKNNIIHRDIKPENLVLDSRGYVKITDFGIAKENEKDNSKETSGTPGYMSPEVILKKNHTFSADFFAIGVIGYEFMKGRRPFLGTRDEIKLKMNDRKYFEEKIKIKNGDKIYKKGCSDDCVDFINSLLDIDANKRLGSNYGIKELKEHQWLKYYMWEEIENKKLEAPFIPDFDRDNFDKDYCTNMDAPGEKTKMRYEKIASKDEYKNAFENFYFNKDINNNKKIFSKKKIIIDGSNDNKKLKVSKSNKNKMILNIRKFVCESSEENIKDKDSKNGDLIKEIINENNTNINMVTDRKIKENKNSKRKNDFFGDIYIRKLIFNNSKKKNNFLYQKNNFSLSPKISTKNIFSKYYTNSNPNLNQNINSESNLRNCNFYININTVKTKNIFTNANKPLIKKQSYNPIYRRINSKNKISNSELKMNQIKKGLGANFTKNKNIRDLFFKKLYNPFDINMKSYKEINQANNNKL